MRIKNKTFQVKSRTAEWLQPFYTICIFLNKEFGVKNYTCQIIRWRMNIRKNRKGSAHVSTGNLQQDRLIRIELGLLIAM